MRAKLVGFLATLCAVVSAFAGYTRMEFITSQGESDSKCSWVNTGYTPACTDRIEVKARFLKYNKTQNIFCSRGSGAANSMTMFFINNSGYKIRFDRGANSKFTFASKVFTASADSSKDYLLVYDGNAMTGSVVDLATDTTYSTALHTAATTYTPGSPLALFASHTAGTALSASSGMGNYSNFRFYYCRVYNKDGKLLHNFVPARDDSLASGALAQYGVYDTIGNTFHANLGKKVFDASGAGEKGALGAPVQPARTIGVTGHADDSGRCATTLTFSNAGFAQRLYCAWNTTAPGGDTTNSWEHVEQLADVSATETTRTVTAPAGAKYARYFLTPAVPGATAVAFLHSTGKNEYIDTGFTPDSSTRVDYSCTYDSDASFTYAAPFGSRASTSSQQFLVITSKSGNNWINRYHTANVSGTAGKPGWAGAHTVSLDHNLYTIDSVLTVMARTNFTCSCSAYVFAGNNNGTAEYYANISLSSLAIWDDGALVRNYVPCVLDNGTPALYDAVNGSFATNKGTTPLTTGAEVWSATDTIVVDFTLPVTAAWTGAGDGTSVTDGANWCCTNIVGTALANTTVPCHETACSIAGNVAFDCPTAFAHKSLAFGPTTLTADCDWRGLGVLNLTSRIDVAGHTLRVADLSGSNGEITDGTGWTELNSLWAWGNNEIVTDIVPACTDRVETEVFFSAAGTYCLWCARNNPADLDTFTGFFLNGVARFDRNYNTSTSATNTPPSKTWTRVVADYQSGKVTLNGVEACTMTPGTYTPASKLCLFASHLGAETEGLNNYMSGYMRFFRLYAADGTLKLDLVPRMRNADSVCGFYDRVSGTFYTSVKTALRMGGVVSTEGTGVLHVEIPEDTTCTNDGVLLNGGLAVVKEGAGTWLQKMTWNCYAGGTRIAAGRVELPVSGTSSTTYCETLRLFGAYATPFTIEAGATFDGKGNYHFRMHPLTLAGTLANTGCDMSASTGGYDIARLGGDATLKANYSMTLASEVYLTDRNGVTDLNGHTLTLDMIAGKNVYLTSNQTAAYTNGTIVLRTGGWLSPQQACEMRTVNLVQQSCALRIAVPLSVRDYSSAYKEDWNAGTADLDVYGTFTPVTDYFYGATLQDGAFLDLSARTNAWSTTSAFTSGRTTVTFAQDATITVQLGTRTPSVGEKIISWDTIPEATFVWDDPATHTAACVKGADGLYYGADAASTVVDRAVWTGAANDGNLRNPANWSCANLAGQAVPNAVPGATSAITLGANTTFNFTSAQWLPFIDSPSDAENKAATVCSTIPAALTGVNKSPDVYAFLKYAADDFVYLGETPLANLRDATWTKAHFAQKMVRFDGWFKVTEAQAGTWTLRAQADDYVGVLFDGVVVASNGVYNAVATSTCDVTAGWHRFTAILGDLSGSYGPKLTINSLSSFLGVSINGAAEVAFEDAFTFGSGAVFNWHTINLQQTTLGADCNWCALATLPDGVLDLNGHTLRVNGFAAGTGVVTNSSETLGTLAVGVAARGTAINSTLTLAGNARLLKDGAGTYRLSQAEQLFTGGIDVAAGVLQPGAAGTSHPFGATGGEIRVAADGTLDLLGKGDWQDYTLRLAGGSVYSSSAGSTTASGFARVTLDADSGMPTAGTTTFVLAGGATTPALFDLNGHTFTSVVKIGSSLYLNNTVVSNGTWKCAGQGGWLRLGSKPCEFVGVTFNHIGSALYSAQQLDVETYIGAYYQSASEFPGFNVMDTFKPVTVYFDRVTLQDGATLDLTEQTATWSATSANVANGTRTCAFANGAKITVDCHGRTLARGDQLVAWATAPQGVDFTLDAASAAALGAQAVLTQATNGLFVGTALTWKGGDGAFDNCANWLTVTGDAAETLQGQTLDVTGTASLTSAQKFMALDTKLRVTGTASFTSAGGLCIGGLEVGATGRLVIDPLAYTLRFMGAPTFADGAKIALAPRYASKTKGRFLLMTWDTGTLDTATLANLFDTSSTAAGASATLSVTTETHSTDISYLWLDLAPAETKPSLNVLVIGDRLAKGDLGTYGNFRIPFVKELEADGYAVQTKGVWQASPGDLASQTMPDAWTHHSSDTLYAFRSTVNAPGYFDAIANVLEQAGDVDFVVSAVGVNDACKNGSTGEETAVYWTNLVTRILEQKPHAKVLAFNMPDRSEASDVTDVAEVVRTCNARLTELVKTLPAKRVYLVDCCAAAPRYLATGAASGDWVEPTMPSRTGMAKIGAATAAAARQALADDPSWQTGAAEAVVVSSGAEANVPAAERAGFTRARSLEIAGQGGMLGAGVPYEELEGVVENIGRVAWYVELKRPNGSTRWMWVAADAWGARDIRQVGVPVLSADACQQTVSRLRVKTNMPGIADTPEGAYERGAVEFTRTGYESGAPVNSTLPAQGWGCDWHDTLTSGNYGSMQVHRFTSGGYSAGEVLFAFNGWETSRSWDIGLGNFANATLASTDWTRAGLEANGFAATMSAAAYEVARLEIWTMPLDDAEVETALWTGAAGTMDLTDPANWSCTNAAGAYVANGVPGGRATVRFAGAGLAFTLPANAYAGVTLGDCTLAADLDLRGMGVVSVEGTVNLAGHRLSLDRLVGGGTITDDTVFDLTTTDPTKASSSTTFYGGSAGNLFNNNYAFSGTDNTKRVIVKKANLPMVVDYDFGTPTTIDAYRIWAGPLDDNTLGRSPSAWTLAGSNDGEAWTTIDSREQIYWLFWTAFGRICSLDQPATYRKYRFTVTDCNDTGYMQMAQLEYGRQSALGELYLDVASGLTVQNSDVTISGQVRVVKDGAGTFNLAKLGQENWSLAVNAGVAKTLQSGSDTNAPLARIGAEVSVAPEAIFDLNGKNEFDAYTFVLNGGMLRNTVWRNNAWSVAQVKSVRLGADSTVRFYTGSFVADGFRGTSIDLRGHTLTAVAAGGAKAYFANTHVTAGTLKLEGKWETYVSGNIFSAPETTVEMYGRLECKSVATMADYLDRTTLTSTEYALAMTVTRRFQPTTEYFYGCTLADGATLDLSALEGTWNTASKITGTTCTNVTFAADAAITIDVHGRSFTGANKKLVEWYETLQPENYDTLTFTLDADSRRRGYRLEKKDDGIYIRSDSTVIFLR